MNPYLNRYKKTLGNKVKVRVKKQKNGPYLSKKNVKLISNIVGKGSAEHFETILQCLIELRQAYRDRDKEAIEGWENTLGEAFDCRPLKVQKWL